MPKFSDLTEVFDSTASDQLLQFFIPTGWLPDQRRLKTPDQEETADGRIITTKKLFGKVKRSKHQTAECTAHSALAYYYDARDEYHKAVEQWSWPVQGRRGMRAIRANHVANFESHIARCRSMLIDAVRQLSTQWGAIVAHQSSELGPAFDIEDYSYSLNRVFIGNPRYFDLNPSGVLPASVMDEQKETLRKETRTVVASAINAAVSPVVEAFNALIKKVNGATRLVPISTTTYVHLTNAEVLKTTVHDGFNDEPKPGYIKVKVRYECYKTGTKRLITEDITVSESEYRDVLRPTQEARSGDIPDNIATSIRDTIDMLKPMGELSPALGKVVADAVECISGKKAHTQLESIGSRLTEAANNLNEIRVQAGRFSRDRVII